MKHQRRTVPFDMISRETIIQMADAAKKDIEKHHRDAAELVDMMEEISPPRAARARRHMDVAFGELMKMMVDDEKQILAAHAEHHRRKGGAGQ